MRRVGLAVFCAVMAMLIMSQPIIADNFYEGDMRRDIDEATRRATQDYTTGVLTGANLSINADPTKFDLESGSGIVVDVGDPVVPDFHSVPIAARLAISDAFPLDDTTWILIDKDDILSQINTRPSAHERRDHIVVGTLVKAGGFIILTPAAQVPAWGLLKTYEDASLLIGGIAEGSVVSHTSGLELDISAGTLVSIGRSISAHPSHPNTTSTPAQTPIPLGRLFKSYEDPSGTVIIDVSTNTVDPNNYALNGVLTPVPTGRYTIQRAFLFADSDVLALYYGNTPYDTLAEASQNIDREVWTEHPGTKQSAFRSWIIIQEGTTDMAAAHANVPPRCAHITAGPQRPGISDNTTVPVGHIIAQIFDTTDQKPTGTTPEIITFNGDDLIEGVEHPRPEDIRILTAAPLTMVAQYQVERTGAGGLVEWHAWLRQGRRDGDVTSVSVANPSVLGSKRHRIQTGQTITIEAGCTTTPSITGAHVATVVDGDSFSIPVNVTAVSDGTCTWTRSLDTADDVANSNIETVLVGTKEGAVSTLTYNVEPEEDDVFNFYQSIDVIGKGAGLNTIAPAGEPAIPSAKVSITVAGRQ